VSESRLRLIAASLLVIGAVLGMAGTFAPSTSLRGLAWGLDGTALIVATALLTVYHLRRGNDQLAAGYLVFTLLNSLVILTLSVTAQARQRAPASLSAETRAAREELLSNGRIVPDAPAAGRPSWRASLDDGTRNHDGSIETADGSDPTERNHRFNVAAYELDKLLQLDLVAASVERVVGGRPASVTWWVDDFAMSEQDRRRKDIEPPDPERWRRQVDAVRVFDELISNTYRDPSPGLYLNSVWDNLLITKDWTIWLIDHTASFRTHRRLEEPESLVRCPRSVLARLRELNRQQLQRTLGKYLAPEQLDALDVRRALLVRHFDDQIASRGEVAVLYDLRPKD
jgi:hypothetical protein